MNPGGRNSFLMILRELLLFLLEILSRRQNLPESFTRIEKLWKIILKRLIVSLNSPNLFSRKQYGFREEQHTTYQVLYFCQRIRDSHNMKPANRIAMAFLNLSKAFNRVWC
ncbi:hypothetical protein NPIL_283521 [Nephila pilipes]|uniref:Reverse transcriptase n=1 Tax=Nephila pilipes TaxID=299642 RepID=A0A8X6MTA8_NEPPI|nr:hypothetical protein NPIL_283521 [Nephila pilipes]